MKKRNFLILAGIIGISLVAPAIIFIFRPTQTANKFDGNRINQYLTDKEQETLRQNTAVFQENMELIAENNSDADFKKVLLLDENKQILETKMTNKGTFRIKYYIKEYGKGTYYVQFVNFNSRIEKKILVK